MRQAFRKPRPPLSPDKGIRQGQAVRAAQVALGSTDAVLAFINTPHPGLGGRPLDVALESDEGLTAVLVAIEEEAARLRMEPAL
jgi:uncharacterized protein (DUF2384 family)